LSRNLLEIFCGVFFILNLFEIISSHRNCADLKQVSAVKGAVQMLQSRLALIAAYVDAVKDG
jgi:DNA-binding FrmR family transcriptional regulator